MACLTLSRHGWTLSTTCFGLGLLGACSTEPRLETESRHTSSNTRPRVLIEDRQRPASRQEYQALLNENASEPEVRAMLDQLLKVTQDITGSSLSAGNDARLLVDGPGTYRAMFEDIDQARHSIHLETFILEDDQIGRALAERLIASIERGVEVRMLIDAVGSFDLAESFIEQLRDQGIDIRKFHPVDPTEDPRIWRTNNRNHRKVLVVDGKIAYTGGVNFSDVYSEGSFSASQRARDAESAWRDTHVRIIGPVAHAFQERFIELWNKDLPDTEHLRGEAYFPPVETQGDMMVSVMHTAGGDEDDSDIYSALIAAIGHAQKRVWVTQAYFAPDEAFLGVIKEAAGRGVDVRLLLPGVTDAPLLIQASRSSYDELLETGVRIYERTPSTLHAKTVVVDGVWSTIGSANFDYRSFVANYELNAVIVSRDFGRAMEKLFEVDLQQTREVTLQAWRNRPIMQRLKENIGDALRPWL